MTRRNDNPLWLESDSERSLDAGATRWVDFASSRNLHVQTGSPYMAVDSGTPLGSDLVRTSSSSLPGSSRQSIYSRPHSSMGGRAQNTKMPVPSTPSAGLTVSEVCIWRFCCSGEKGPPPLPTQSPFADASALLEATRPKPMVQRSQTEVLRVTEETPEPTHNLFPHKTSSTALPPLQSSSRSFSEIRKNGRQMVSAHRQLPMCPALKVKPHINLSV